LEGVASRAKHLKEKLLLHLSRSYMYSAFTRHTAAYCSLALNPAVWCADFQNY